MSIDNHKETFYFITRLANKEPTGGWLVDWIEGEEFEGCMDLDTSLKAKIAEAQNIKSLFSIYVSSDINLQFQDIIKRKCTGEYYKITSSRYDNKTPPNSPRNMYIVNAEKIEKL